MSLSVREGSALEELRSFDYSPVIATVLLPRGCFVKREYPSQSAETGGRMGNLIHGGAPPTAAS
eukprot:scaffold11006_cov194-Alexandrium_tamarense.AAC.8